MSQLKVSWGSIDLHVVSLDTRQARELPENLDAGFQQQLCPCRVVPTGAAVLPAMEQIVPNSLQQSHDLGQVGLAVGQVDGTPCALQASGPRHLVSISNSQAYFLATPPLQWSEMKAAVNRIYSDDSPKSSLRLSGRGGNRVFV